MGWSGQAVLGGCIEQRCKRGEEGVVHFPGKALSGKGKSWCDGGAGAWVGEGYRLSRIRILSLRTALQVLKESYLSFPGFLQASTIERDFTCQIVLPLNAAGPSHCLFSTGFLGLTPGNECALTQQTSYLPGRGCGSLIVAAQDGIWTHDGPALELVVNFCTMNCCKVMFIHLVVMKVI